MQDETNIPIWSLDNFDWRQLQGDLCLTGQERWFNIVDLDINVLLDFRVGGCREIVIKIRVLRWSASLITGEDEVYIRQRQRRHHWR